MSQTAGFKQDSYDLTYTHVTCMIHECIKSMKKHVLANNQYGLGRIGVATALKYDNTYIYLTPR